MNVNTNNRKMLNKYFCLYMINRTVLYKARKIEIGRKQATKQPYIQKVKQDYSVPGVAVSEPFTK